MRFASVTSRLRRRPEAAAAQVAALALLLLCVFVVRAGQAWQRAEDVAASDVPGPAAAPAADPGAAAAAAAVPAPASDLEPIVIDVEATGPAYRLGGRRLGSARELTDVLRPLAGKAEGAFVRVNDDAPLSLATGALQACREAGLSPVSYVPAPPGE